MNGNQSMDKPIKMLLLVFLALAVSAIAAAADDVTTVPVEKLIDDLALIDSQAPGLHGTAAVEGFIAEDKPLRFGGGVLGSGAPKVPPQMRELVRRGVASLPALLSHIRLRFYYPDDYKRLKENSLKAVSAQFEANEEAAIDPKKKGKK